MRDVRRRPLVLAGVVAVGLSAGLSAQPRPRLYPMRPPPAEGRQIETADGDTVLITGDDRVTIVRQRTAEVRVVFDQERRTALVLADWGTPANAAPDGGVNRTWLFSGVEGTWPFEARWQGTVTLAEPESLREHWRSTPTLRLDTGGGTVSFVSGPPGASPAPEGTVIWHRGMSGGGTEGETFDQAERSARARGANGWQISSSTIDFANEVVTSGTGAFGPGTGFAVPAPSLIPIRRVEPVWPDPSTLPGVRGVMVAELAVAPDGSVRSARMVRSLPPLDDLVMAAVTQWRYAAAGPEGRPDPLLVNAVFPYPVPPRRPRPPGDQR